MRKHLLLVGGVALVTVVAGIAVAASASAGTTTYEAEAGTNALTGGAHVADCKRCSGGHRVTGVGLLGQLTFTGLVAERAGPTKLQLAYAGTEDRTALLSVNGGVPTAFVFPATRGEGRIGVLRVTLTLRSGDNALAIGNPAGAAPDIDKLVVTTDGTPPTLPPTATVPVDSGTAAPTNPPASGGAPTSPPASAGAPTSAGPPGNGPAGTPELEAQVVALVNTARAKAGCKRVVVDGKLAAAARGHSTDMAARNYYDHSTPEGVDFGTRIVNAGYSWASAAENIAKGPPTAQEVMKTWLGSAAHRAAIVNCGYRNIGVGVAADSAGVLLWTQDFAKPN